MNILRWKQFLESIGEIPIFNIDIYNKRMEVGWEDKLFFLNKINPDVIVDFGCADGSILVKVKNKKPGIKLIGYEPDEKMLSIAKSHLDDAFLTSDWNEVVKEVAKYSRPAILLSSVIHEVYSYSHHSDINKFWNHMVFSGIFKWICIRDMMPSIQINNNMENLSNDISKVRKNIDSHLINSYEEVWGEIKDYKSLMHFLLKYKYVENWDREVEENYFPLMLEELYALIPTSYQITYQDSFLLPHLPKQFKDDFGININKKTHAKIIITNKKFKV